MLSDLPHLLKKASNNIEKSMSKMRNSKNEHIRNIMVRTAGLLKRDLCWIAQARFLCETVCLCAKA